MGAHMTRLIDVKPFRKSTFGVIYRHTGITDIPYFERRLETIMTKLNASNTNYYLIGDFNVNSLLYNDKPNIKSFIDMMHANFAVNLINKPTRFPRERQYGSPSILDHFYTNTLNCVQNIGLLSTDISDHLPIIAIINMQAKKMCFNEPYPYIRDFRNVSSFEFNKFLREFRDTPAQNLDFRFF